MTTSTRIIQVTAGLALGAIVLSATAASAQIVQRPGVPQAVTNKQPAQPPPAPEPNYVIGPEDVLSVTVWHAPEVSGEVRVRPDGKITLSLGQDIVAAGLTPDQLKSKIVDELKRGGFYSAPDVFIQVKQINSRMVYVTGNVGKQGAYPLSGPMTVLQLITVAGGLQEFADKKNLLLVSGTLKDPKGQPLTWKINFDDMSKGKNLSKYNVELRPGDTLIVR